MMPSFFYWSFKIILILLILTLFIANINQYEQCDKWQYCYANHQHDICRGKLLLLLIIVWVIVWLNYIYSEWIKVTTLNHCCLVISISIIVICINSGLTCVNVNEYSLRRRLCNIAKTLIIWRHACWRQNITECK